MPVQSRRVLHIAGGKPARHRMLAVRDCEIQLRLLGNPMFTQEANDNLDRHLQGLGDPK
jgi:hypothetical protein